MAGHTIKIKENESVMVNKESKGAGTEANERRQRYFMDDMMKQ